MKVGNSLQMQQGYVALMSVLVLGAITTAVATTLVLMGADSQRETLVVQQSAQARSLADACAEEALQQIHDNTSFAATDDLFFSPGFCTYTVTSTGANTRTISITSTVGNIVRKITVYVTISASSISITSWQEVS